MNLERLRPSLMLAVVALPLSWACSSHEIIADGFASISTSGEDIVEHGISAPDGWSVSFDHVVVSLNKVDVRDEHDFSFTGIGPLVVDMLPAQGAAGRELLSDITAPALAAKVSFQIGPSDPQAGIV